MSFFLIFSLSLTLVSHAETVESSSTSITTSFEKGLQFKNQQHLLKLGLFTQGYMAESFTTDTNHQLAIKFHRVRPIFEMLYASSNGLKQRLMMQLEFVNTSSTFLDLELELKWNQNLSLFLGRYRPFSSRSLRTGLPMLTTPDRGLVCNLLCDLRMNGVTVFGNSFSGVIQYTVGFMDAGSLDVKTAPTTFLPTIIARLSINPLGPAPYTQVPWHSNIKSLLIALEAYTSQQFSQEGLAQPQASYNANLSLYHPHFFLTVEGFDREGTDHLRGAYGQLGTPIYLKFLDLTARYGEVWKLKRNERIDRVQSIEVAMNAYIEKLHSRLMLVYMQSRDQVIAHKITLLGQLWAWM